MIKICTFFELKTAQNPFGVAHTYITYKGVLPYFPTRILNEKVRLPQFYWGWEWTDDDWDVAVQNFCDKCMI